MSTCACPPPPGDYSDRLLLMAPPPVARFGRVAFWLMLVLLLGSPLLRTLWPSAKRLQFTCDVFLLMALLISVPALTHALVNNQKLRVFLESVMFMAVILAFSFWIGGRSALGLWLVAVAMLVLVIEIGSNILEYAMEETSERAMRILSPSVSDALDDIREMFDRGRLLYVSVPLGLLSGMALALARGRTGIAGLQYCYLITIGLASLFLAYLIVHAFARMCSSMFSRPAATKTPGQADADFAAAMVATAVRKFYLYETLHDVVLFGILIAFELSLRGISLMNHWKMGSVAMAVAIYALNQLPFSIGQSAMHRDILRGYDEVPRAELQKKLSESAPLSPTSAFIAAQVASGTVGAFLYALMESVFKEKMKMP